MPRKFNKFVIEFKRAPGDCTLLTALVRDLHRAYGNRYQIDVRTQFPALWRFNPYLARLNQYDKSVCWLNFGDRVNAVDLVGLSASQQGVKKHYLSYFHQEFERRTGIHVPLTESKADLHLSKEEKANPNISGRYWIIVPGGKIDITNKWWHQHRYQEVVDQLHPHGIRFVQEGCDKDLHHHPVLSNVVSMVGLTSIRDLIVNIHHAEGVVCGVTLQMHLAGALEKPCVVINGGREEPWYEAYVDDYGAFGPAAAKVKVPHRYLHTLGQLRCCQGRGCWKRRVQKLNDGRKPYDKSLCLMQHRTEGKPIVPECMDMIQTDHVTEALMSYYEDGTLKPIGKPTGKYRTGLAVNRTTPVVERETIYGPPPTQAPAEPKVLRVTERPAGKQKRPIVKPTHPISAMPEAVVTNWDHPKIGGKITVCMLMHGKEHNLHRRLFTSVCRTVPEQRVDLRVACNQVPLDTLNMLNTFPTKKIYQNNQRRRKAEAMREVFYDEQDPISTRWTVWFDDIAFVKHPLWLSSLIETISNQRTDSDVGLVGLKVQYKLVNHRGKDPRDWFANAPWFRGKLFRNKLGKEAPNGDCIHLVQSNFFAVSRQLLQAAVIPDTRISQSGSAICLGEQAHQLGFRIKQFNADYRFVQVTHTKVKRGLHEKYPWE